jgi:hypothetical protein
MEKYTSLEDDESLVEYFEEVLKRRDKIDLINAEERRVEEEERRLPGGGDPTADAC